ncbi:Golgi transport complex subunit 3 [Coemansia sp. RSA 552]|nr:Golgi transport complex subunit 3 [Coemansia sp. RSA 552]
MPVGALQDDWEQRYAIPESCRTGIARLQEASAAFPAQLLSQSSGTGGDRIPRLNPHAQLLRAGSGSPLLNARRRNASVRSLAGLSSVHAESADNLGIIVPGTTAPEAAQQLGIEGGPHVSEPIETTAQFLEWYGKAESQLAAGQDQESHAFAERLRGRVAQCSDMLQCLDSIESLLQGMEADYARVCRQTEGVKSACAEFQDKRDRLERMSGQISEQLEVYNSLGPISRLFNSPGDRVCLNPEFLPSLERTESAIKFIEAHADGRDSELYLMRFGQCQVRALTLIKLHAQRVFRTLSAGVSDGLSSAALYVQFRASAVTLAPLLHALQARCQDTSSGMERQILLDVQNSYFQVRRAWLRPYIQNSLKAISAEHDMDGADARVESLRDWCAFVMNVCADEYRLYYTFFDARQDVAEGASVAMSAELRAYLDTIMELFHEHVRPLIIHEQNVAALANLTMTLLTYHKPEDITLQEPPDETGSSASGVLDEADENGLDSFYTVIYQILQDAQQRLAYRAQTFIRSQIAGHKFSKADIAASGRWVRLCLSLGIESPEDLDKLVAEAAETVDIQGIASESSGSGQAPVSMSSSFVDLVPAGDGNGPELPAAPAGGLEQLPNSQLSAADVEALQWVYPPVESYHWLVAQISGCLDHEVEAGIAEEALAACKQNLLGQGARFVRHNAVDGAIKTGNAQQNEAIAEQLAHLFVRYNLADISRSPTEMP